jgi:hypothetical protein
MLKLIHGKSYVWILVVLLLSYAWIYFSGYIRVAALMLPLTLVVMISSEIRSHVALDSWWRATYVRSQWQYTAIVAWHVVLCLLFSGVAIYAFLTH